MPTWRKKLEYNEHCYNNHLRDSITGEIYEEWIEKKSYIPPKFLPKYIPHETKREYEIRLETSRAKMREDLLLRKTKSEKCLQRIDNTNKEMTGIIEQYAHGNIRDKVKELWNRDMDSKITKTERIWKQKEKWLSSRPTEDPQRRYRKRENTIPENNNENGHVERHHFDDCDSDTDGFNSKQFHRSNRENRTYSEVVEQDTYTHQHTPRYNPTSGPSQRRRFTNNNYRTNNSNYYKQNGQRHNNTYNNNNYHPGNSNYHQQHGQRHRNTYNNNYHSGNFNHHSYGNQKPKQHFLGGRPQTTRQT